MNLTTNYLGLTLEHPLVASASPLGARADGIKRLADSGASAIVMPSLFEEQIVLENSSLDFFALFGSDSFDEASHFFPKAADYQVGPDEYLDQIRVAKALVRVPVIASLNGLTPGGWTDYAKQVAEAGADALELNIFWIATDRRLTSQEVENRYVAIVEAVRRAVTIPIAVKLSPAFSSFGNFAHRLAKTGIDGLVLFNRFYQPDIDLDRLEVVPALQLSTPMEIRQGLLWIGVLRHQLQLSLAASSGVHSAAEVIKYLLVGADVVMTTSLLLHDGPEQLSVLRRGLIDWANERGYTSIDQLRGSMSQAKVRHPGDFERANYLRVLQSYRQPNH